MSERADKDGERLAPGTAGTPNTTIDEVARAAGVSSTTVSRYMRGERVRRAEAVAAAVARLNYRPNAAARGLRMRTTEAVAVVAHDITNPYVAALVRGVQSVASPQFFSLFVTAGPDELEAAIFSIGTRVDGIICAAATESAHVEALKATGRPTVLVEFEPADHEHDLDVVVLDNVAGSRRAVEELIGLGHRRIGVIAGPDAISVGRDRLQGAEDAAQRALADVELLVARSDFGFDGGYQATARLLGRGAAPTAIFAPNNLTALGSLHCIHDLGIPVPDSLSFIGFDPLASHELFTPPPTTVDRPESEQGALAMRLLESRMRGRGPATARRIVLETTLTLRASCGPPPPARR
jgi:LacI family transcriptional regulator